LQEVADLHERAVHDGVVDDRPEQHRPGLRGTSRNDRGA
jgi:hypothetical protein